MVCCIKHLLGPHTEHFQFCLSPLSLMLVNVLNLHLVFGFSVVNQSVSAMALRIDLCTFTEWSPGHDIQPFFYGVR